MLRLSEKVEVLRAKANHRCEKLKTLKKQNALSCPRAWSEGWLWNVERAQELPIRATQSRPILIQRVIKRPTRTPRAELLVPGKETACVLSAPRKLRISYDFWAQLWWSPRVGVCKCQNLRGRPKGLTGKGARELWLRPSVRFLLARVTSYVFSWLTSYHMWVLCVGGLKIDTVSPSIWAQPWHLSFFYQSACR